MAGRQQDRFSKKLGLFLPKSSGFRFPNCRTFSWIILIACLVISGFFCNLQVKHRPENTPAPFYFTLSSPKELCKGESGLSRSTAGFIGLQGDTEQNPKRSFFWYFEAEEDPEHAPVILAVSGGPGTSGMTHTFLAQGPCLITPNGTIPNPNAWTQRYNLVSLDHPIGVGWSHGSMVNNSRDAAVDVYDFLQKFFTLFPRLARNKFIVTGGSYGGIYLAHIATVIQERNKAITAGQISYGAIPIKLDSLVLSNSLMDLESYFYWSPHYGCYTEMLYNKTQCSEIFSQLPACLEMVRRAFDTDRADVKSHAWKFCRSEIQEVDIHGIMWENIEKKCDGSIEDCQPIFIWLEDFMNSNTTRAELGIIPSHLHFRSLSDKVTEIFTEAGDHVQRAHLLYQPLLDGGIRILHYLGDKDANCPWTGVLSTLRLIHWSLQEEFINAPEIPWPESGGATIRTVGVRSGNLTVILIPHAGHFTAYDNPGLARKMVQHWIDDQPFIDPMS